MEAILANTYSPFGFRPFGRLDGGAPTAGLQRFYILSSDTNSYYTGDCVAVSSLSTVLGYISLPQTSLPTIVGVFAGCEYYNASISRTVWNSYFPASVGSSSPCNAYVITDPDQLFTVQCTTTSGVVGTSCIGLNINIASSGQTSGNTTTGISNIAAASSAIAATSSYPFRIVDTTSNYAPPGVNGADGTTAGAIIVVQPNNWQRKNLTAYAT